MKRFADFLMFLGGWKLIGEPEEDMKNCVFIEAPHTSMWDFVWGRCGLWKLGVNAHFFIKKEMFFFPLGLILRVLGGVPVDRKKGGGMVETAVRHLKENSNFSVIITPEGTRKYNDKWKKGFYYIAMKAEKPIYLSWLDYEKKQGGSGIKFYPTGNYEEDLKTIQEYYKDKVAKYPENFNLSKQYQNKK